MYLLRGQIRESLQYHPLVLYMALVFAAEGISWGLSKIFKNPKLHIKRYQVFLYIGIGITILNWLWKNYILLSQGIYLLPL